MANSQIPQGYHQCAVCEKLFILSSPNTFEFDNDKSICKYCWLIAYSRVSWGSKRETRIIFDYKKVTISHKLKWTVWERDNFTCLHCGSIENLSIDHIIPENFGGGSDLENLQTLYRSCNSKKSYKI